MYNPEDITRLLGVIRDAKLSAPREMFQTPPETLCKICNGVGGTSMSPKIRAIITKAYTCVEATAAIHDWRYSLSDGTPERREAADREFLENGLTEVKFRNKGLKGFFRRLWDERKVLAAYRALEECSEGDWCINFRNNVLQIES